MWPFLFQAVGWPTSAILAVARSPDVRARPLAAERQLLPAARRRMMTASAASEAALKPCPSHPPTTPNPDLHYIHTHIRIQIFAQKLIMIYAHLLENEASIAFLA